MKKESGLNTLIPAIEWLIEKKYGKKSKEKQINNTYPTKFALETESEHFIIFFPFPNFSYLEKKQTFIEAALEDKTIDTLIFIISEKLQSEEKAALLQSAKKQKQVEIWDADKLSDLFTEYLTHKYLQYPIIINSINDFKQILEEIDSYQLSDQIPIDPKKLLSPKFGIHLLNLQTKFSGSISRKILKKANDLGLAEDQCLFTHEKYSKKDDAIAVSADIVKSSEFLEKSRVSRSSSFIAERLKPWYEAVDKIIKEYNGFVDKFMGDGFLAFFGYPFQDNRNQILSDTILCCRELIKITKEYIYEKIIKELYPELEKVYPGIGNLRIGICTGEIFTLPTNIFNAELYQHFLIIGNCIVKATRIQSGTDPGTIGIMHESFTELKKVFPNIENIARSGIVEKGNGNDIPFDILNPFQLTI